METYTYKEMLLDLVYVADGFLKTGDELWEMKLSERITEIVTELKRRELKNDKQKTDQRYFRARGV